MAIDVADSDDRHFLHFDPAKFFSDFSGFDVSTIGPLKRPKFIPIVASVLLAQSMLKRAQGNGGKGTKGIDGFVIEMPTAGGHNAPPRGFKYDAEAKSHALALNERGEPVYGTKDEVDLVKFRKAVKALGIAAPGKEIDAFFETVDTDKSQSIDYRELTMALRKAQRQAVIDAKMKPPPPQACVLHRPLPYNISLGLNTTKDQQNGTCVTLELDTRAEASAKLAGHWAKWDRSRGGEARCSSSTCRTTSSTARSRCATARPARRGTRSCP